MPMGQVTPRDREWMARALQLARRGDLGTAPNPRVGCLLVRDDQLLSQGWHARVGEAHAEAAALLNLPDGTDARGATAYVTLEPCSHHGRTPPCSDALVAAGITRCVVGLQDPNPMVSGRGLHRMRAAGIDVLVLDHHPEGRWLNRRFLSAMERGRPWIVLKCAVSADGFMDPPRTAGQKGSLAITSPRLRTLTHRWRAEEGAILVGAGTVDTDDPGLDVREAEGPQPLRVVLDPRGRTAPHARAYTGPGDAMAIGGPDGLPASVHRIEAQEGALAQALEALHEQDIRSVLIEGGAATLQHALNLGLWDELRLCRSEVPTGGGLAAPAWPKNAILRGLHPYGQDCVEYHVHPESARWVGIAPPPTLQVPLP